MSAYKVIRYLLANDSTVAGLVTIAGLARIYPVTVPDVPIYPCLVIGIITERSHTLVSLNSPYSVVEAKVQVTVLSRTYLEKEQVMNAVIKACKSGSATIDGVITSLVMTDLLGPDFRDDTVKLYMQSQDFKVMYNQAN